MKRIEYTIESAKINEDKNIAICSDIHISKNISEKKITDVLQTLTDIKPTHIVIPGDLYDVDTKDKTSLYERTSHFIEDATKIADVFYVKGNIEQKSELLPYRLYNNNNPRFHLLCERNSSGNYSYIHNGGINIAGIKLPLDFYRLSENERAEYILRQYKNYLEELSKSCGTTDFNILLCHDPIIIRAMQCLATLNNETDSLNFDLIISGHNHGGIWPDWMKPLFKLMHADMQLCYPTYIKGMIEADSDSKKIIVSEGITKFHSDFGSLQTLERFHEGTLENVRILSRKKIN